MMLIYRFDNEYSCDVEQKVVRDPKGGVVADLTDTIQLFDKDLKKMSGADIWALCRPIVLAHECGTKQAKEQMIKNIYKVFGLKEEY